MCAEVGDLDRALDYRRETALTGLHDLHHNTGSGLHLACLAGTCAAAVEALGGLQRHGDTLRLAPALPEPITGLRFPPLVRTLAAGRDQPARCAVHPPGPGAGPLRLVLDDELVLASAASG